MSRPVYDTIWHLFTSPNPHRREAYVHEDGKVAVINLFGYTTERWMREYFALYGK